MKTGTLKNSADALLCLVAGILRFSGMPEERISALGNEIAEAYAKQGNCLEVFRFVVNWVEQCDKEAPKWIADEQKLEHIH